MLLEQAHTRSAGADSPWARIGACAGGVGVGVGGITGIGIWRAPSVPAQPLPQAVAEDRLARAVVGQPGNLWDFPHGFSAVHVYDRHLAQ